MDFFKWSQANSNLCHLHAMGLTDCLIVFSLIRESKFGAALTRGSGITCIETGKKYWLLRTVQR
jgi:hypothetical protein